MLREGRIIHQGSRAELLRQPRDRFVADSLGVNLLMGIAEKGPDGLAAVRCDGHLFYSADEISGATLLTCDPRDIVLSPEPPEGVGLNVFYGRVISLAHYGAQTRVTLENGITLLAEITHWSAESLGIRLGD